MANASLYALRRRRLRLVMPIAVAPRPAPTPIRSSQGNCPRSSSGTPVLPGNTAPLVVGSPAQRAGGLVIVSLSNVTAPDGAKAPARARPVQTAPAVSYT